MSAKSNPKERMRQLRLAVEQTELSMRMADGLEQGAPFSQALGIGESIAQEALRNPMSARARISMLPSLGFSEAGVRATCMCVAMSYHWGGLSEEGPGEAEERRSRWMHSRTLPSKAMETMDAMRDLGLEPGACAWGLIRPMSSEALLKAKDLMRNYERFSSAPLAPREVIMAPFFVSAALADRRASLGSGFGTDIFPPPGGHAATHLISLNARLGALAKATIWAAESRWGPEERRALSTLNSALTHPDLIAALEREELELAASKPSARGDRDAGRI